MSEMSLRMHESEFSAGARDTIQWLQSSTLDVFAAVRRQPFWELLLSPTTPLEQVRAMIRELFFAVYSYQRHTTEAGFLMIGRLPKSEHKLISVLTRHKAEEAEHGEWALRDYIALGGNEDLARQPPTPAAFAVASIWWRMAMVEEPFGYLGAEYLFEYLTAIVTAPLAESLAARKINPKGFGFVITHATEDVKHTNLIRHLIGYSVTRFPEARCAMLRCFQYFAQVYPLPLWSEVFARSKQSVSA